MVLAELNVNAAMVLAPDFTPTTFAAGHNVSGPPATVTGRAVDPTLLAFTFSNHAEVRYFSESGGNYPEDHTGLGTDRAPPVVLPSGATTALLAGDYNGAEVVSHAVYGTRGSLSSVSLNGGIARIHLAGACTPNKAKLAVSTKTGSLATLVVDQANGGLTTALSTGNEQYPLGNSTLPAVILDHLTNPAQVFSAWESTGNTTIQLDLLNANGTFAVAGMSRLVPGEVTGMALVVHNGSTSLAATSTSGSLHVYSLNGATGDVVVTPGGILGGVSSVALMPSDAAPTFFFGDSQGKVHAVRAGAELSQFGFPLQLPAGHRVIQPPLLFRVANGQPWILLVVSETGAGASVAGYYTGWTLGSASSTPGQWPEYQGDQTNRGCVVAP
jgi:hypothetical protein